LINQPASQPRNKLIAYCLWLFNIAMEICPFIDVFVDDLPIKNGDSP